MTVDIKCDRKLIIECETDSTEPLEVIQKDVEMELSCCWNWMQNIKVKELIENE